jgi:diguanylate cyclase (GGDEF)-like protein
MVFRFDQNQYIKSARISNANGLEAITGEFTGNSERISTVLYHPSLAGVKVGILDIYLNEEFIQQQTEDATQKEFFILLSLSLILAFFVSILVHSRLTKPIQKLIDNFEQMDPHSPTIMPMLPYKGKDEIGKLVIGINALMRELRNKSQIGQVALDIECKVGDKQKWMHCLFAKITDQRTEQRETASSIIEVILYDVTERAERELQTRFEADHDLLTHLLNRRSGEKKLHKMLFFSIKNQQPFVLMMIDLDKFKPINDTFGHEAGDKVLQEVAKRITMKFSADTNVCIRWGGDEFVVAFHMGDADNKAVKQQADVLLTEIQKPIQIQPDATCTVSASIGLVIAPKHGKVLHELLVNADNTMYKVKEQERGRVEFYSPKY